MSFIGYNGAALTTLLSEAVTAIIYMKYSKQFVNNIVDKKDLLSILVGGIFIFIISDKRRIVHEWIRDTFNPIKTYNVKHSTYSLKELLERKTGIYLTNNQMKDALLNMGYICQNEHKINWLVNVSEMGIKYVK